MNWFFFRIKWSCRTHDDIKTKIIMSVADIFFLKVKLSRLFYTLEEWVDDDFSFASFYKIQKLVGV